MTQYMDNRKGSKVDGNQGMGCGNGGTAERGDGMSELRERVIAYNTEVKAALQAVYNDLNQGQRKKLLRNPTIRAMFERYGVETDAARKE